MIDFIKSFFPKTHKHIYNEIEGTRRKSKFFKLKSSNKFVDLWDEKCECGEVIHKTNID